MKKEEGKMYCIFNHKKETVDEKIEKAFEIYLKDYVNTKKKVENNNQTMY